MIGDLDEDVGGTIDGLSPGGGKGECGGGTPPAAATAAAAEARPRACCWLRRICSDTSRSMRKWWSWLEGLAKRGPEAEWWVRWAVETEVGGNWWCLEGSPRGILSRPPTPKGWCRGWCGSTRGEVGGKPSRGKVSEGVVGPPLPFPELLEQVEDAEELFLAPGEELVEPDSR